MERKASAVPWTYKAFLQYVCVKSVFSRVSSLHFFGRGAALQGQQPPAPNLLFSRASDGAQRALWLLHRPGSVLGLVVSPRRPDVFRGVSHELTSSRATQANARVLRHLRSLPFQVAGDGPGQPPIVVHKNHLIGCCLNGSAAPLYAHTVDELARLRLTALKTLSPENAFVCASYCEWDDWREVSREPGWSWHWADEQVANSIITGQISFDQLQSLAFEVS